MEDEIFAERKASRCQIIYYIDRFINHHLSEEERRVRNAKRRKMEREIQQDSQRNVPQGMDFGAMTAMPIGQYNQGVSNSAVVSNRSALRTQNQSAAAALRAELMGGSAPQDTTMSRESSDNTAEVPEERGTKRKASEIEEGEDDVEDDGPATAEDTDLEAKGRAILEKVAKDKKAADQAARDREPDDAVR